VTEAWSGDHFQPEMSLLGSAGRQYTQKNIKLTSATFEGELFYVFMGKKNIQIFFKDIAVSALKSCIYIGRYIFKKKIKKSASK
jgi:hypothetical protein